MTGKQCSIGQSEVEFYSLFYLNEDAESFVNLSRPHSKALETYAACASVQMRLMTQFQAKYKLITNSDHGIDELLRDTSMPLDCRVEAFERDVPFGIPFRSAHFKLDVIKGFAEGRFGSQPTLIDLDVLPVMEIPFDSFRQDGLLVYDITEQMIAEIGLDRLRSDLAFLTQRPVNEARWFGGEFISGTTKAFSALSREIERLWPKYRDNIDRFAHVGDEMLVTAALVNLCDQGIEITDVGDQGLIARWWSARTRFRQRSLCDLSTIPFWHLPADKEFIASLNGDNIDVGRLQERYADYIEPRIRWRRLANPFLNFLRKEQKYISRIGDSRSKYSKA